jgi:hypothetical protein
MLCCAGGRVRHRIIAHINMLSVLGAGYDIDVTYTSRLKRAIRSTWILMMELNQIYTPVFKSWRLNEVRPCKHSPIPVLIPESALDRACLDTALPTRGHAVATWMSALKPYPIRL